MQYLRIYLVKLLRFLYLYVCILYVSLTLFSSIIPVGVGYEELLTECSSD